MKTIDVKLSKREHDVCSLLIIGNSTTTIAKTLNLKCNTVSTIKKSIFNKTKTNNLIELYEVFKQV